MKTVLRIGLIGGVIAWALLAPGSKPAAAHPVGDAPISIQSPGGHDRPGPPPIITTVTLVWVEYPYLMWSQDWGSYAEPTVSTAIIHEGHGYGSRVFSTDVYWPDDQGNWLIVGDVYSHLECSPMNPIRIQTWGIERDASNLDEAEARMLEMVVDLTVSDKYLIGRDIVLKLLKAFFAWINPDDSLGYGEITAPGPGSYEVNTSGGDYNITALYDVSTAVQNTADCDPNTPIPPSGQPIFGFSACFDTLLSVHQSADSIRPEAGANDLSPQDIADARTSVRSEAVGLARWLAAHMLEQAQPYYGFSSSLYYFNLAASESGQQAIADYRQAGSNAEYAIDHFGLDPGAQPMPPVIAAFPEFLATRSGRSVDYLIGVFGTGAQNVSIASVTGGPPGAFYTIQTADPDHPWLKVLHVDQNGAPGTYTITVTFTGALDASPSGAAGTTSAAAIAPLTLTLDLDEARTTTAVDPAGRLLPDGFALAGVHPNPVRTLGSARLDLPVEASVSLALFDVAGHRVRTLASGEAHNAGTVLFRIDARDLAAGVYYLRAEARPMAGGASFHAARSVIVTR